jgi:hypothetical protein
MKLVLQIAAGVILAVVIIVGVLVAGRVSHQQEDMDQQQAEFCKKVKAQGMSADDLAKMGCKQ